MALKLLWRKRAAWKDRPREHQWEPPKLVEIGPKTASQPHSEELPSKQHSQKQDWSSLLAVVEGEGADAQDLFHDVLDSIGDLATQTFLLLEPLKERNTRADFYLKNDIEIACSYLCTIVATQTLSRALRAQNSEPAANARQWMRTLLPIQCSLPEEVSKFAASLVLNVWEWRRCQESRPAKPASSNRAIEQQYANLMQLSRCSNERDPIELKQKLKQSTDMTLAGLRDIGRGS